MADFRFEDMEIWNDSINLSDILPDYADRAEKRSFLTMKKKMLLKNLKC
jgi:hypothetical protein